MVKHNKIGIKGELIAADYLLNKGYIVLYRNWRSGKKEIDIVAVRNEMVVVVEIKTRSARRIQFPEEAVDHRKKGHLKAAGLAFLDQHPQYRDLRFDIISILMEGETVREIVHFEEAFY